MNNWSKFLFTRVMGLILTLWVIITMSFFIIRLAPGGPFDREKPLPKEVIKALEAKYHLNDPIFVQYLRYLGDIVQGDLGPSMKYEREVNHYISSSLPHSVILGVSAILLALVVGVVVGIMAALKQNRWQDYASIGMSSVGISIPLFVIGPLLMFFLAIKLNLLPTSGWITGRFGWKTLIMPVSTLALPYIAIFTRLTRASALDVINSDYIRTAVSKGLPYYTIIMRHMLKGTLLPVVSYLAPALAAMVTGSMVIERMFRIPGLGQFAVQASFNRDYPMVMGIIVLYSSALVVMNFFADIAYAFIDPRITYK